MLNEEPLEGIQVGKIIFQHSTEVTNHKENLAKIERKLIEKSIEVHEYMEKLKQRIQILEDLKYNLQSDHVENHIECKLNPRGNNFYTVLEEEHYNSTVYQYKNMLDNLNCLGLSYTSSCSSIALNSNGEEVPGPYRMDRFQLK